MNRLRGISLTSATFGALTLSLGLSLVACGSDSSSGNDDNKGSNGIAEYETLDDLVHCTKSHYGEFAHVTETDSIYECTSEGWVAADSSKIEELLSSSASQSDKDNSGKSSSSVAISEGDTAKVEIVKVDSVTVLGLAEKGAFTKGSVVKVYGLDSAFEKSKTSFKGAVNDDKGNYSVSSITLASQYAMVEVNGFFNNEVTGKVTSGTKTKLRALVDLSEGDTVKANVNVLTDLEYERAIALVKKEALNVPAAKARATKEIFAAFGVTTDAATATRISLSDDDAATNGLFAASVALMGNRSISKFHARLSDVAESFAAAGSISDTLRAEMADDLSLLDSNGSMADIIKNIEALNSKATGVDSLLYAFWSSNYKLPACDEKNEETIAKNDNKLSSNYGAGYACTNNRWHKSTALDTELGLCVAKNEGKYESTKAGKYYTCTAGQWREITKTQYELGACTEDIAKDASKKYKAAGDEYFLCKELQWEEISVDEFELKDCDADNNKKLVVTKTSENSYVCLDGAWRKATDIEAAIGEYCNSKLQGQYRAAEISGSENYFVCKNDVWEEISATEFELKDCGSDNNEKVVETKTSKTSYVCLDGAWRKVTDIEVAIGNICSAKNGGKFGKVESQDYHCDGKAWTEITALEAELGLCADSTSAKWKQSGAGDYYNCSEKQWTAVAKETFILRKFCSKTINGTVEKYGETGYVCEGNAWREFSDVENKFGYCEPSIKDSVIWTGLFTNETRLSKPSPDTQDKKGQFLVCNGDKWVGTERVNYWYGICNEDQQGVYMNFYSVYPKPYSENVITPQALSTSRETVRLIYMEQADFVYAKCEDGKWNPSTYAEVFMWKKNESCTDGNKERRVTYSQVTFSCFQGKWYETIKDSRDNHVYRITTAGNQTWLAENLNYDPGNVSDMGSFAWQGCYNDSAANCTTYGRLYTWEVAMNNAACGYDKTCNPRGTVQGVCPKGWHLPSRDEWNTLLAAVGGASTAGTMLKTTSGWYKNGNGSDKFGFSALPAGDHDRNGDFLSIGVYADFWSSTEYDSSRAYSMFMFEDKEFVDQHHDFKSYARSVRCLKD